MAVLREHEVVEVCWCCWAHNASDETLFSATVAAWRGHLSGNEAYDNSERRGMEGLSDTTNLFTDNHREAHIGQVTEGPPQVNDGRTSSRCRQAHGVEATAAQDMG